MSMNNPQNPQQGGNPPPPNQSAPEPQRGSGWSPTAFMAIVGLIAVVVIVLLMFGLGGGDPDVSPQGDVNVTQETPATPTPSEPTPNQDPASDNGSVTLEVTPPADNPQPETAE